MTQHIFPFESELQNDFPEAAPSSPSLSPRVSEKLALYGSSGLSAMEHLTLLVGNEGIARLRFSEDEKEDNDGLLSMWRGYGGNGKEVAIVLDTERILLDEQSSLFIFSDVHYGTHHQHSCDRQDSYSDCRNSFRKITVAEIRIVWK